MEIDNHPHDNKVSEVVHKDEEIKTKTEEDHEDKFGAVNNRKHGFDQELDSDDEEDPSGENQSKGNQGMITGVLIPCLQSILGIILFIRLPDITGEVGIFGTYLII